MYEVTIINNEKEKVINAVSMSNEAPRIEGQIKEGINAIDSFTFTIYENNPEYNNIIPFVTLVHIFDVKKKEYIFKGRVLTQTREMDESGICSKEYVCESELGYLNDSVQEYETTVMPTDKYLKFLLDEHNKQVETHKRIYCGVISKNLIVITSRTNQYDSTWKNINDNLLTRHGGELRLREEGGVKYLDYINEIGENSSVEIRLSHNLKSMNEETKFENFYTRIIPLGVKLKEADENGNTTDSGKRLTIESINNGIKYLEDRELVKKYGIITGFLIDDDITLPEHLIKKAQTALAKQQLSISNTLTAYDLYYIGLDMDNLKVGNRHLVINEKFDLAYQVRIVEKSTDINNPIESSITIGDTAADAKTMYASKIKNTMAALETVLNSIDEQTRNNIRNAVNNATNKITGAAGGFVLLDTEYQDGTIAADMPWRILVMDTPDKNTAKNVMQINKNGIGFSKNGINGPYTNAWTIDGQLVADFITVGKIQAGVLEASVIQTVWNGISDYIKLIGGELRTLDSENNLVSSLNRYGQYFYHSGNLIGKIGTNHFNNTNINGLTFDLEEDAGYMSWAAKDTSDGNYIVKMAYYHNDLIHREGIHFQCDTFCHSNLKFSENVTSQEYADGSAGIYSEIGTFRIDSAESSVMSGGTSFAVTKDRFTFYNSRDLTIDCYNNIDMHNYSILNQSDARLKKNIKKAQINALDIVNQIELKEYDWIESSEHVDCGIIAQQLQEICPDMVTKNADGVLSIKIEKFIPLLLKAVQEITGDTVKHKWKDRFSNKTKEAFTKKHPVIRQAIDTPKRRKMAVMEIKWKDDK